MKKTRLRALALFTVISIVALSLAFITSANGSQPIIYRNDTKYSITEYPVEIVNGVAHLPVSFFIGLKNVRYANSTRPVGFYLTNEKTGRFFSFSADVSSIMVDSELTDISFPIINSTVYLPLEYCAEILSLKIEKKTDGKATRIRVSDGSERLNFDELIELYDPTETPDDPPVITPERPLDPTPPVERDSRALHLTFNVIGASNIDEILELLDEQDTNATFFFDKDACIKNPSSLVRAFVSGHEIGIYLSDSQAEPKSVNDAIYSVLNFYTRLCKAKTDTELTCESYLAIKSDFDADDWQNESARETARALYNSTFSNHDAVASFPTGEKTVATLKQLFYYLSDDEYITLDTITLSRKENS